MYDLTNLRSINISCPLCSCSTCYYSSLLECCTVLSRLQLTAFCDASLGCRVKGCLRVVNSIKPVVYKKKVQSYAQYVISANCHMIFTLQSHPLAFYNSCNVISRQKLVNI